MATRPTAWESALKGILEARKQLWQQNAQDPRVNKRRKQLDTRLLDIEMAICWLIAMANDEAKAASHDN